MKKDNKVYHHHLQQKIKFFKLKNRISSKLSLLSSSFPLQLCLSTSCTTSFGAQFFQVEQQEDDDELGLIIIFFVVHSMERMRLATTTQREKIETKKKKDK